MNLTIEQEFELAVQKQVFNTLTDTQKEQAYLRILQSWFGLHNLSAELLKEKLLHNIVYEL